MFRHALIVTAALSVSVGGSLAAQEQGERTEAEKTAIAKVRQLGGQVMEIARDDARLEVAYHLADDKVTDEYLVPLKELKTLIHLNLRGTEVTDAGLEHLKSLKTLVRLHLERTGIGEAGLENLKGLENLEYLNLYGTQVTDAGLAHLAGLKKLRKLYVWQTQVTDAGIEKLKAALPELEIISGVVEAKPEENEEKAEDK